MQLIKIFLLSLLFISCGQQPQTPTIPGLKGPFFNLLDGSILISMELENLPIQAGGRFPIPKLSNSFIEVTPAQFGGSFYQVSLDLKDIENGDFRFVDPQSLPGGRPLPGIIGGTLPSLAVNIPDLFDSTFYVSKQVFGLFIPLPQINVPAIATYRLELENRHLGNLSLVGRDEQGENSGILLLLNLKNAQDPVLKRMIQKSKQKKGQLF